ncbi:hypothetical protein D5S18_29540 [Nocardia panacis]|uniref:Type II toxin-antitoxin system HipA family toxin n=1 Tax=Nocardia panacis TaxID=2340916 RepID=A0A3A4KL54_9NOCA|nr:hypothetical protein D5S18_29540 [Nocardia panacis]
MADELVVFLAGRLAGYVDRSPGGRYRLTYAPEYRRHGQVPLSPVLRIGDGPFRSEHVEAFLDGLLPEKVDVRTAWAAEFGTTDEVISLLGGMGLDCVGAVQFVRPGDERNILDRNAEYPDRTDRMIGARLRALRETGASWTLPGEHWSLPGAQDKFTLTARRGRWSEPFGSGSSTHIVKPGIHRLHHQAVLEYATMRVARRLGLRVANVELCDFAGESAIVVERFDRISVQEQIFRLHQVDFCQAMGRTPPTGGLGWRRCTTCPPRWPTNRDAVATTCPERPCRSEAGGSSGRSSRRTGFVTPTRWEWIPVSDLIVPRRWPPRSPTCSGTSWPTSASQGVNSPITCCLGCRDMPRRLSGGRNRLPR